jgi:hypothetical protein
LLEQEHVTLSIQRIDHFVKAHEITDERKVLAIACLIRACECSRHDVTKFANVAHENAPHIWIEEEPSLGR